jgi:hypothetical protein
MANYALDVLENWRERERDKKLSLGEYCVSSMRQQTVGKFFFEIIFRLEKPKVKCFFFVQNTKIFGKLGIKIISTWIKHTFMCFP